jgi:hypothetical protein
MTRAEVFAAFHVNALGLIAAPGRFEGEPPYVPAFHDRAPPIAGDAFALVAIEPADRAAWPELPNDAVAVAIWLSPRGLVCSKALSAVEADRWRADAEADRC